MSGRLTCWVVDEGHWRPKSRLIYAEERSRPYLHFSQNAACDGRRGLRGSREPGNEKRNLGIKRTATTVVCSGGSKASH